MATKKCPKTKVAKKKKMRKVLREFKEGKLRSGSKKGPKVRSKAQALAVALSESGQSKKRPK